MPEQQENLVICWPGITRDDNSSLVTVNAVTSDLEMTPVKMVSSPKINEKVGPSDSTENPISSLSGNSNSLWQRGVTKCLPKNVTDSECWREFFKAIYKLEQQEDSWTDVLSLTAEDLTTIATDTVRRYGLNSSTDLRSSKIGNEKPKPSGDSSSYKTCLREGSEQEGCSNTGTKRDTTKKPKAYNSLEGSSFLNEDEQKQERKDLLTLCLANWKHETRTNKKNPNAAVDMFVEGVREAGRQLKTGEINQSKTQNAGEEKDLEISLLKKPRDNQPKISPKISPKQSPNGETTNRTGRSEGPVGFGLLSGGLLSVVSKTTHHDSNTRLVEFDKMTADNKLGVEGRIKKMVSSVQSAQSHDAVAYLPSELEEFLTKTPAGSTELTSFRERCASQLKKIATELENNPSSIFVDRKNIVKTIDALVKEGVPPLTRIINKNTAWPKLGNAAVASDLGRGVFHSIYQSTMGLIRIEPEFKKFNDEFGDEKWNEKKLCRQETIGGTLTEVFVQALDVYPSFKTFMNDFGKSLTSIKELRRSDIRVAPLKGIFRSLEKIGVDNGTEIWDANALCDVVRGSVVCDSMKNLQIAVRKFIDHPDVEVVRIKNRFANPTPGGWADLLVNVRLKCFESIGPSGREDRETSKDSIAHIVELQFIHEKLLQQRKGLGGHRYYAAYRAASEYLALGVELYGMPPELFTYEEANRDRELKSDYRSQEDIDRFKNALKLLRGDEEDTAGKKIDSTGKKHLNLAKLKLDDRDALALGSAIAANAQLSIAETEKGTPSQDKPHVQAIDLSCNLISAQGGFAIARGLAKNPRIRSVKLYGNNIPHKARQLMDEISGSFEEEITTLDRIPANLLVDENFIVQVDCGSGSGSARKGDRLVLPEKVTQSLVWKDVDDKLNIDCRKLQGISNDLGSGGNRDSRPQSGDARSSVTGMIKRNVRNTVGKPPLEPKAPSKKPAVPSARTSGFGQATVPSSTVASTKNAASFRPPYGPTRPPSGSRASTTPSRPPSTSSRPRSAKGDSSTVSSVSKLSPLVTKDSPSTTNSSSTAMGSTPSCIASTSISSISSSAKSNSVVGGVSSISAVGGVSSITIIGAPSTKLLDLTSLKEAIGPMIGNGPTGGSVQLQLIRRKKKMSRIANWDFLKLVLSHSGIGEKLKQYLLEMRDSGIAPRVIADIGDSMQPVLSIKAGPIGGYKKIDPTSNKDSLDLSGVEALTEALLSSDCSNIEVLSFKVNTVKSKSRLSNEGLKVALKILPNLEKLRKLSFTNCNLTDSILPAFFEGIRGLRELKMLALTGNKLTIEGMGEVLEYIRSADHLETIYLGYNTLSTVEKTEFKERLTEKEFKKVSWT